MALTQEQLDIITRTVLGEARGEGELGMVAVAHNIRNRSLSGKFPSDPAQVALQPYQYSTWNKGEGGNNPQQFSPSSRQYQNARKLVEEVWGGNRPDPTNGALFYHTPQVSPAWAGEVNKHGTTRVGNHIFYNGHPVPPGEIPNVVASQIDVTPKTRNVPRPIPRPTVRKSAEESVRPYLTSDMQVRGDNLPPLLAAQITPGLGSLTPDFFKPQFTPSRLPPEAPMSFAALDRGPRSRADVPLPQPRPSRSVTGFPTPLPGYQSGPQVRLPEIAAPPGYNRMDAMAGLPSNAMRQELALQGQSYAGMDRTPSSGVGRPPATRTVPSVPVRPTQTAAVDGVGYMPTMGLMRATLGSTPKPSPAPTPTTAIPGPNALPKSGERIAAGLPTDGVSAATMGYGAVFPALPDMGVGTALDVVPQVIPGVPIGTGMPPAPFPRPQRSGVSVAMPTPVAQRPPLPMPRSVMGFPTALSQRPVQSPTLRVAVNGANSYSGGGSSGGVTASSGSSQPRYVMEATGKEVRPVQTSIYNPDTNQFEKRTVYR